MPEISICLGEKSFMNITVDFSNDTWKRLHMNNLPPFHLLEARRKCRAYPEGIFPGSKLSKDNENKQIVRIFKFPNLLEFSKIVEDETVKIGDQIFLTTKFYERRKLAWTSRKIMEKEGNALGYYINGDIYNEKDKDIPIKSFFSNFYLELVKEKAEFKELIQRLARGECLVLKDDDDLFIQNVSILLLQEARKIKQS